MTPDDARVRHGALTRRQLREQQAPLAAPPVAWDAASDEAAPTKSPAHTATSGPVPPSFDRVSTADPSPAVSIAPEPASSPEPLSSPELTLPPTPTPTARAAVWSNSSHPATALTWIDPTVVALTSTKPTLDAPVRTEPTDDVLADVRVRSAWLRPGVLAPLSVLVAATCAYAGAMALWPLHAVAPIVQAVEFAPTAAPEAVATWPGQGSAAVGIQGLGTLASSPNPAPIASITKVVSSLMVLDEMPLAAGEQGPSYEFDRSDNREYWQYRRSDQSALDVPVGGSLTEYQLLQGVLMGSANNYIDLLAEDIWGSDRRFSDAAEQWLSDRDLSDITVVTPSGRDLGNVATPDALIRLGQTAMQNPVFSSIVGTPVVDLPGAGTVTNTNGMLAEEGVTGIKTGTINDGWSLLTSKQVMIGDTAVQLYAAVLNQAGDEERLAATRSLFVEVEAALRAQSPTVPQGTVVGEVQTEWGTTVDIVTDADTKVVLWNAATATAEPEFDLGERRAAGEAVGTLTAVGPIDRASTKLSLAEDVAGPSFWWRLTHPLQLLGIDDTGR